MLIDFFRRYRPRTPAVEDTFFLYEELDRKRFPKVPSE
ncbi:hypothetical protein DOT_3605 [Desulfosporosinus sp. OT]|nr:hypothetical protein DOT_3605 [Desulfosporosinus sp. OT]